MLNGLTCINLLLSQIIFLAILAVLPDSTRAGLVFEAELSDNVFPSGETRGQ